MATREERLAAKSAAFKLYWTREPNKIKVLARQAVYRALKSGKLIKPDRCEECHEEVKNGADGRKMIFAIHCDYSRPLEVQWLCPQCSGLRRRKDRSDDV